MVGNLGRNSRFKASPSQPVRMYYNDFDNNDSKEQILTFFLGGRELVFTNMADITSQIPSLKKRYLYAKDFAKASLTRPCRCRRNSENPKCIPQIFLTMHCWFPGRMLPIHCNHFRVEDSGPLSKLLPVLT
jgi:hypothetical protein